MQRTAAAAARSMVDLRQGGSPRHTGTEDDDMRLLENDVETGGESPFIKSRSDFVQKLSSISSRGSSAGGDTWGFSLMIRTQVFQRSTASWLSGLQKVRASS